MRKALTALVAVFGLVISSGAVASARVRAATDGVGVAVSTFVAGSTGYDGLFVIKPDGHMYINTGVGNLGTHSCIDLARVAADVLAGNDKDCMAWIRDNRDIYDRICESSHALDWSSGIAE